MSEINDGGPAFPAEVQTGRVTYNLETQSNELEYAPAPGMTLRDYFAAKAMAGMCAHGDAAHRGDEVIAKDAYGIADAMLRARGQS